MNIQEINDCFHNGFIPNCLFYNIVKGGMQIDPRKICYTDYYQSYEFYESKFDKNYSLIPGFDKIIKNISKVAIETNKTPLQKIDKRRLSINS